MYHICYVYIFKHKMLRNVELVINPNYTCAYNNETYTLTISKSQVLPENFWGNGIYSLTGILGDNGAGKSTALCFLLDALASGTEYHDDIEGLIVYENDGKLYIYSNEDLIKIVVNDPIEYEVIDRLRKVEPLFYFSGHFSPSLMATPDPRGYNWDGIYNASDMSLMSRDVTNHLNLDSMHLKNTFLVHLNAYLIENNYRICMLLLNNQLRKVFDNYRLPKYIIITPNTTGEEARRMRSSSFFEKFDIPEYISKYNNPEDKLIEQFIYNDLLNVIYDQQYNIDTICHTIKQWQQFHTKPNDVLIQFDEFIYTVHEDTIKTLLKIIYDEILNIKNNAHFNNNNFYYLNTEEDADHLNAFADHFRHSDFYLTSRFFDLHYAHSIDLSSLHLLSSGEQELLNLFSRIYDAVVVNPQKVSNAKAPIILLFDEAETAFHPEWQRIYLDIVVNFIQSLPIKAGHNFQIIITSHSPLLLSDIPRCCTNYLSFDGCRNVNLRNDVPETFATNIFELYRKYFQMSDGLIGAFAQKKIKEIQQHIEQGPMEIDYTINEIQLIGDIRLREFLLQLLHKKICDHNDRTAKNKLIQFYEKRLSELQYE